MDQLELSHMLLMVQTLWTVILQFVINSNHLLYDQPFNSYVFTQQKGKYMPKRYLVYEWS